MEENSLAHERWCNDLAAKLLCVFVLDRFGDFVSDQVCFVSAPKHVACTESKLGCGTCPRDSIADTRVSSVTYASTVSEACPFHSPTDDPARLLIGAQANQQQDG